MAGEAAPAAADLQHVIGGLESQLPAERVVLFDLRVAQRLAGRGEARARVGHRLVEPEAVEIVPEIVVLGDVAAAGREAVGAEEMQRAIVEFEQVQREGLRVVEPDIAGEFSTLRMAQAMTRSMRSVSQSPST